jgi:transcriptional regulator with XRE-family HTH domain
MSVWAQPIDWNVPQVASLKGVMVQLESQPTTVGGRIRLVRTRLGLTLEQLAEKAEISKSFLWDVEQGSDISGERLLRVANVLRASLDYLMRGETAPDYKPTPVEIPSELHALAEQMGLSYRKTIAVLDVDRSIKTHRREERVIKDEEYWRHLFDSVKDFLED